MITATDRYDPEPDLTNFYQGDVIANVPYFIFPTSEPQSNEPKWGVLRPRYLKAGRTLVEAMRNLPMDLTAKAAKSIDDLWKNSPGEYFVAAAQRQNIMIVTRSCAIDKPSTKHFLIAPVIKISDLATEQRTDQKLADLRSDKIFDWFYLPAVGKLEESFADLSQMIPVHWTFFGEKPESGTLMARLSSQGTSQLEILLSSFYGTIFGFDRNDTCKQTGLYACSRCFYSGVENITRKIVRVGQSFGECPTCGELSVWVKLPPSSAEASANPDPGSG